MTTVLLSNCGEATKMSLVFASSISRLLQIYKPQKIINYACVEKRGRLQGAMRRSDTKSFQSNALSARSTLPNHGRPSIVPVVIIISVTVKGDTT